MSSRVQIISFLVSFIYGILFYLVVRFNKYVVYKKSFLFNLVFSILLVIDVVILYIFIMYKINYGDIHPYFVFMVVGGYIVMCFNYNKCKEYVKKKKIHK